MKQPPRVILHRRWIILALGAACFAMACGKKVPEAAPAAAAGPQRVELSAAAVAAAGIKVEKVDMRPVEEILRLPGTLAYDENKVARIGPRVGGRVARILVDFGQVVRAGQVLAEMDSPDIGEAVAQWRKSQSLFNVRQRDYERAKRLLDGRAISQGEFLSREGEFQVAKAEMENADSRLHLFGLSHDDLRDLVGQQELNSAFPLRSPIAGSVIERQINPGEVVEAGKPLFTVGNIDNLWLQALLYEKELSRVHAGQEVEVTTDAYPGEVFKGTIDYVGDQVDAGTRTVRARSMIPNPERKLKPGMFVEARLSVASGVPILAVPKAAVQEIDKTPTVFVEVSPSGFEVRQIELGRSGTNFIAVTKGLRAGERVVSMGSLTLKAELQKSNLAEE